MINTNYTIKMKNKGFYPLFTTLGLVLVIMAVAIVIQWGTNEDKAFDAHIDRLSWLRINNAVDNMKAMVTSSLKDIFYDSIMKIGKIDGNATINKYLNSSKDDGWARIVNDLRTSVSERFNSLIPGMADYSDGQESTFVFEEGINVTIGELSEGGLDIKETKDGLVGIVELPMAVTNRYQGWEATLFDNNITIPLNVRLKDTYSRAWDFNQNYENYAKWTFTGALYARAYLNAYGQSEGPLLKEAHYTFDPIATLLFGDLNAFNDYSKSMGSTLDIGAIPAATWLTEWQFLSEPSFLPAGFDLTNEDKEQAQQAIENNYRMGEIEETVCGNATDKDGCKAIYDLNELEKRVDYLREEKDNYTGLSSDIHAWLKSYNTSKYESCKSCYDEYGICYDKCRGGSKCEDRCEKKYDSCKQIYDDAGRDKKAECQERELNNLFETGTASCDDFRDAAATLLKETVGVLSGVDEQGCLDNIQKPQDDYTDKLRADSRITASFKNNDKTFGFEQSDDYCVGAKIYLNDITSILKQKLNDVKIDDQKCQSTHIADCAADSVCETHGDCDTHCSYPSCPGNGENYDCVGDLETYSSPRVKTCRVCEDGRCQNERDEISQCTCRCRPSIDLLEQMNNDLSALKTKVDKAAEAASEAYDSLEPQLERRQASDQLMDATKGLDSNDMGYDVFSRIDPMLVKYDKGALGGQQCYINPSFKDRDNGVCGDSIESAVTYTVQIAAAALATLFSGGAAAPIMDYVVDFFPVIFDSEVEYNLTETLIDDKNRIILTNIGGDGSGLYTYAPFEFEIYKNREFRIGSITMDRLIVYVYLPAVKGSLERVISAMTDSSCKGKTEGCN